MADKRRVAAVTVTLYPEQLRILDIYAQLTGGNRSASMRGIIMEWARLMGHAVGDTIVEDQS